MNKMHMVDQNKTKIPRQRSELGYWMIIIIMMTVGTIAMLASQVKASPVECSVTGVTTDNLMSSERAEYMMLFEHGEEFTEYDLE